MNRTHLSHLLELNLAMLCIATSGPLGRYVDLPVPLITGIRGLIAFVLLVLFCKWRNISLKVDKQDLPITIVTGVLMATHWLFYFYALQWSNVAIGMLSLFTYPVITAFLEPIILKSKLQKMHLVLGGLVLMGIYFLSPNFNLEDSNTIAIFMGLISALSYALRNIILKLKVEKYQGTTLMVYQTGTIGVLMLPALFLTPINDMLGQWEGLLALGVITTAVGHSLFLMTFKHFSITTVSILSSVQPIYGILIGVVFLNEIPKTTTIIGGALILSSVVIESYRSSKKKNIDSLS
ncbi:DMT family transporter [Maribacter sp. PR1]|uniref:DMT family transporter n=1 Tax=Maribacter cobaltidurans TaxID=1178778 RepID=A0ABU7IT97_9FLAO|nr:MULTISPECIES: DMT family transporter [Maribacter]MDC6388362.1 DMT family transporter [Maribacter sp. PR1]MEE1975751.1 DMT family transporter [Maribacter cobaltidurans]